MISAILTDLLDGHTIAARVISTIECVAIAKREIVHPNKVRFVTNLVVEVARQERGVERVTEAFEGVTRQRFVSSHVRFEQILDRLRVHVDLSNVVNVGEIVAGKSRVDVGLWERVIERI